MARRDKKTDSEMWILYSLCLFVSVSGQNDVRLPPSITKGPEKEIIFRENQEVKLTCRAEGIPPPTFEWRQNGNRRSTTGSAFTLLGDYVGDLTINNANKNDDGFFQCSANNKYGTALSTVAYIQQAFLQDASLSYVNITVQEGHPFVIHAARRNSFPTPWYSWETATGTIDRDPKKFQTTQRVRQACNGDLYFAYAEKTDGLSGGIYKNRVINAYTDQNVAGSYSCVNVTQGSETLSDFPPNITYFSKSQDVALVRRDIELMCFFSGKPLPNITWSRPGNSLPSERYSIPSTHYGTLLIIYNITESDEGDYVCTAENINGTASHTFIIPVETVPIFEQVYDGPYNVNVTEGDSITFNCSAFAKPEATVLWFRNGQPIDVIQPPKRFVFSNNNKSLTIRDVCRNCVDRDTQTDLMVIQCNASNVHGYVFASGYINVLLRTNVTLLADSTVVSVDLTKENRFQFDCSATSDPSTSTTVRWYKVGDQGHDPVNKEPPYVNVMNGNLTISIGPNCSTVCEKYLGEYRCIGDNGYTQDTATIILNGTLGSYSSTFHEGNDATVSWSQPNADDSFDKKFRDLLEMVNNLERDALNQTVVADIASQLSTLTNKSEGLSPGNLNASIIIMNRLAFLLRDSSIKLSETESESMIQAVSNVLRHNEGKKTIATLIWLIMDDFGLILANMSVPGHITVYTDNLVLQAWAFETSNLPLQIEFPNGSFWGESRGDRISISMETLKGILSENSTNLKMWGVYYRNIHDKLPGKNDTDDVVNSRVISFSIVGLKSNVTLKPPVLITLQHNEEKPRSYRRTCGFWNFNRSDWDSFGCSVSSTNKTHTTCSCDHLTNFAILMSRNPVYDTKLSLISIIGCSISVAALLLTVIIYAVTWKHAKSSQAALLLNLCIALIIAYIIFMTGADKVEFSGYSMVGCQVVAVLLHYFFLVAFFIMLAEGVDMVLYIFFVFHVRRTRETVMLVASAWVLPMIIVGVSLGVTRLEGYGHDQACWLSMNNGLIWAFIGPVLCIIVINLVILIIILRLISKKKAILAKNSRKREEIRATIWNLSVMCPVLGLGWLFGVFSVSFDHVAFQYVFVIANSLHGLLIFIIYALFHNKKMNETISAVYSQYRKTDSSVSNHMNSSSQEHSTNSTANIRTTRPSLQLKSSDSDECDTKAAVSTHNSGLKDSLLENKADIHQETAFDHR